MPHVFRIRRGLEADLPTLAPGEPAIATDTNKFYIGTANGNILINDISGSEIENIEWSKILSTPTTIEGYGITNATDSSHLTNFANPHEVTYEQVGAAPASHALHISPIVSSLIFGGSK